QRRLRVGGKMSGGCVDEPPQGRAGRMRDRDLRHARDVPVAATSLVESHSMKKKAAGKRHKMVVVKDRMQRGYRYALSAPTGKNFDPEFNPDLTPGQMLALGVFCGKYMNDTRREFPKSWFTRAKLTKSGRDCSLNYFRVDASQPLREWQRKGWIYRDDP